MAPERLPITPMLTTTALARCRAGVPTTFGMILSLTGLNVAAHMPMARRSIHACHWDSAGSTGEPACQGRMRRIARMRRPRISSAANMSHLRGTRSPIHPAMGDQRRYGMKKKKSTPAWREASAPGVRPYPTMVSTANMAIRSPNPLAKVLDQRRWKLVFFAKVGYAVCD